MFRLLDLLPSAKILDMFVSDEIDHIFEKVREEYVMREEYLGKDSPTQLESHQYTSDKMTMNHAKDSTLPKQASMKEKDHGSNRLYWIAGGAATVGAATALVYFLMPTKVEDKNYAVPNPK